MIPAMEQCIATGPLVGQTFLLTGRLTSMTCSAAEEAITMLCDMIATGVSKSLTHPLEGSDTGSKLAKAQQADVSIYDEQWLLNVLKEHGILP